MGFIPKVDDIDNKIDDCKKYIKMFEDVVRQYREELERLENDKRRRTGFHTQDSRDYRPQS